MKRNVILSLLLILGILLCGCGKSEPQTGSVTPLDGFDNAGFVEIECNQSGQCSFSVNDASTSANVSWEVYVMNKQFDDAPRYIPQAKYKEYATVSAGGEISVKKGNYMYIYCSQNAFTLDSKDKVTKDASISYSIK